MSAFATSLIGSSRAPRFSARRGPCTAEKYRNRDGNQQTSADFDGRTPSLRTRVYKRRFDVSSRWHAEGQARDAIHCRIRLYLRSRAAPLRGTAGAPATGLCAGAPARPGRAAFAGCRRSIGLIQNARSATAPSSSAPIVRLAGTASRPPCGRRCEMASPAWTRHPLARRFGAREEDRGRAGRTRETVIDMRKSILISHFGG
jgi:hypothetical protein